ncbi:MAG: uroporphyrinogen-III C-methyltransferase, partial [Proteobacteria bacterium]|nr:uroporphyrinogen-III C-methyltransferase [Pseudomonadota bacterium]
RLWDEVIGGPIADAVERGDEPGAAARMLALVNAHVAGPNPPGTVYLVGAGPGDPDLLTLRAIRALQRADVVVHDRLVGSGILEMARRDAERIYVGKEKSGHAMTQAGINALLAARAEAGETVVRLKGGDPFVFGRGGEELDYLRQRGISVQVVPGISAAAGCAAAAGIPLTHRDLASSVTFVSGHAKDGVPRLDWPALAQGRQTIVVYMGVTTAPLIARRLIAHGLAPGTPVAVVENGTLPDQRVLTGNLRDLATLISANRVTAPALIIIGEVVALSNAAAPSLAQADAASSVAQSAAELSVAV